MPLPAYLICAESAALDRESNKVSAFNFCEQIPMVLMAQLPQGTGQPAVTPQAVRIISAWLKEEADNPDMRFEIQIVIHFPHQENEVLIGQAVFSFAATFNRVITPPITLPGSPSLGIFKVETRVRREGEINWIAHQYFYIELVEITDTFLQSLSAAAPTASPIV